MDEIEQKQKDEVSKEIAFYGFSQQHIKCKAMICDKFYYY